MVLLSFTAGSYAAELRGFSVKWYGATWRDPFVLEAFRNSFLVAGVAANPGYNFWHDGRFGPGTCNSVVSIYTIK